jgi:hypothetical protein
MPYVNKLLVKLQKGVATLQSVTNGTVLIFRYSCSVAHFARARQTAFPMPPPAPVTNATCPDRQNNPSRYLCISSSLLCRESTAYGRSIELKRRDAAVMLPLDSCNECEHICANIVLPLHQ